MTIEEIERLTDSLSKKINELANTGELPKVEQKRAIASLESEMVRSKLSKGESIKLKGNSKEGWFNTVLIFLRIRTETKSWFITYNQKDSKLSLIWS